MLPEPLHPAVVHFPIVLVAILPVAAIAALILIRRGEAHSKAWTPMVLVALALLGSAWVAVRTGEGEEERVEEVVAESAIHEHEEAAEVFLPLTAGMLLLAAGGLLKGRPGRAARGGRDSWSRAAVGRWLPGWATPEGDLVYEYGAASAYVAKSPTQVDIAARGREHSESDDAHRRPDEDQ